MCFIMRKRTNSATPTRTATMRRHLSFNPELGPNSMRGLKRAIALASFITPAVIHQDGEEIYLNASIQRHLRRVYDVLRKRDPILSRTTFANFLETEQGEVSPDLTEEGYNFQQFLEVWLLHFGLQAQLPAPTSDKDLSKPLSNYFISSSHNTYLSGSQWTGRSTADAYKRVLRRGCRCVEIDVWNKDSPNNTSEQSRDPSAKPASRFQHVRGLSGGSLHTVAAHIKDTVEDKIEKTRQRLGVEKVHSRSPKCNKHELSPPPFGREFGANLDPASLLGDIDTERSSLRSRPSIPPDEPIVMHGYTFTSPVGFREVCRAVREVGFETTNLPIIISLEVHADPEQQETMVQIMKEEWAGLLVEKPHETCPNGQMPKLGDMLNKILVKVKRASPSLENAATMSTLSPNPTIDDDGDASEDDRPKKPKVPICESLSALAIYTHSEHFTHFESPAAKIPSHIFSINEVKILELITSKHQELFSHNRHFFMRAYPKGLRVDSSNLDPSPFWRKGVQMVAMNWQSWDEGMMLNEAMFSGEQGWVLKPPGYRSDDPAGPFDVIPTRTIDLIIIVLAGQHLSPPEDGHNTHLKSLRPVVRCELHIEKAEERFKDLIEGGGRVHECEYKQKTRAGKTDHPDFGNTKNDIHFLSVRGVMEQLSFVKFKVDDATRLRSLNRDSSLGWACIRLDRLATGYRLIHLLDANGNETQGRLLVRIDKNYR
ncbi:PLC-like phosphodiesterase [Hypoxylon trugodes]|uniref:PLC-like phosphodiesterase n=1 Tax=Hypoxylon trugodes TaxID=326681 RepID=UPI002190AF57|nr:PLC-like phosphodiesterase [Hypoxylon trugodes]KAI1392384.1 PLC-like phosphodiesterase [Hypoxylon trugodes]